MHDENLKYIYYKDKVGEVIGYIAPIPSGVIDVVYVNIIALREPFGKWEPMSEKAGSIAIDLRKGHNWKIYDDREKFFEEYFEAIL